jgi:hypothetical protein
MTHLRGYVLGAAIMTALALIVVLPDTIAHGDLMSWLLIVLVVTFPLGAAAEVVSLRRTDRHEVADALVRWTLGLTTAIALVVWFDSYRVDNAREECAAEVVEGDQD